MKPCRQRIIILAYRIDDIEKMNSGYKVQFSNKQVGYDTDNASGFHIPNQD